MSFARFITAAAALTVVFGAGLAATPSQAQVHTVRTVHNGHVVRTVTTVHHSTPVRHVVVTRPGRRVVVTHRVHHRRHHH